jgi:hypothetical protein
LKNKRCLNNFQTGNVRRLRINASILCQRRRNYNKNDGKSKSDGIKTEPPEIDFSESSKIPSEDKKPHVCWIHVDGESFMASVRPEKMKFSRSHILEICQRFQVTHRKPDEINDKSPKWNLCGDGPGDAEALELLHDATAFPFQRAQRGPGNCGPARQVFARKFFVVSPPPPLSGIGGSDFIYSAAVFLANSHYESTGTLAEVVSDRKEEGTTLWRKGSSNLILLGRPDENKATAALMRTIFDTGVGPPVSFFESRDAGLESWVLALGPCVYSGDDIGVVFTAPHWDNATGYCFIFSLFLSFGRNATFSKQC